MFTAKESQDLAYLRKTLLEAVIDYDNLQKSDPSSIELYEKKLMIQNIRIAIEVLSTKDRPSPGNLNL